MMKIKDSGYYIDGILNRNRRILSKAITLIESSRPDHQALARKIVNDLLPHTGQAVRLGITGVPGVGKSTFIESMGLFLTGRKHSLAVLAVDPSSRISGGSIMADKTRMEKLSVVERAFIRPSPSGGTLGGVARKTRETLLLCEAFGFEVVIVETVGVGQSETTVASMVDFFLVLMLAGSGDELQGIKKGIMELADAVAVNKSDGDNRARAEKTRQEFENAMHLITPAGSFWNPPVITCSAKEMLNIDKLWGIVQGYYQKSKDNSMLQMKRKQQSLDWMWSLIDEGLKERFFSHIEIRKNLKTVTSQVEKGSLTPTAAAGDLLFFLDNVRQL
jgi:LAO/AO transport system kinase